MNGDEQQAELADPDQEPIERDSPRRRFRRGEEEHHRDRGEEELSAASISGDVWPTPTLIAMKVRPQTIATLSAARMSRALMPGTGE